MNNLLTPIQILTQILNLTLEPLSMRLKNVESAKQRLLRMRLHLFSVASREKDEAKLLAIFSHCPEVVSRFYNEILCVFDNHIREAPTNGSRGVSTS
jgi:hypothetical protein